MAKLTKFKLPELPHLSTLQKPGMQRGECHFSSERPSKREAAQRKN